MGLFNTLRFIIRHPLNHRKKSAAILRFLKWQIGSRLVDTDIIYPWIDRAKVIVRHGDTGFTQNIYCGLQEFPDMAYVLHGLACDELFVDIGANIGAYSILAGVVVGARVICFEPVPSSYQHLVANLKINHAENRVKALNIGIGHETGNLRFTDDLDTMNHVISPSDSSIGIEVTVSTLDAILVDDIPAIIKIDVEGFETRVLEGAINTLQKDSLHSLIVEMNGQGSRYGFDESKIMETLGGYGFNAFEYDPFTRLLLPLTSTKPYSGNVLFVREPQLRQNRLRDARKRTIHGTEF